jgi:hypothetical protein
MDRGYGKRRSHKPIVHLLDHVRFRRKGDYRRTLMAAERTIDPARIHIVFFERLFNAEFMEHELQRICSFLELSYQEPADFGKSNAARDKSFVLDDDQRRVVVQHYEGVMRYMARYEGGLPTSWQADLNRL